MPDKTINTVQIEENPARNFQAGEYDIIVIGAGHAGVEAALAAARMGCKTMLTTLNLENLALMPCNPSVGGPAKGHLVREIDALGGEMGVCADKTCIQFRLLNTGKGPAVQALRAQADKKLYQQTMTETCENQENLDVKQMLVEEILFDGKFVTGVRAETGETYSCRALVLATGTYLRGRMIIGETMYEAGPNGQRSAINLSKSLKAMGIKLMRFKTGTPARLDARTLDYDEMEIQPGDDDAPTFSFMTTLDDQDKESLKRPQIPCYLTYTNEETHKILRENMHRAPMANGVIEGIGPRYCPSIESKLLRFPDKDRHPLFIEPEGLHTREMYVQGMSTSMPVDVQEKFLHTIKGLTHCRLIRPGYAIEYDCLDPLQLTPSLATKAIPNFFSAGQANGTSGYEEAAAQGLLAGINAVRLLQQKEPLILKRNEAYIGVLIDDLVTKGTQEPYRMMTARAEYRLLLRQDNADLRLTEYGKKINLVTEERYEKFLQKKNRIAEILKLLQEKNLSPNHEVNELLTANGLTPLKTPTTLYDLLRRPEINYEILKKLFDLPEISHEVREQVEISIRYEGYIQRQMNQVKQAQKLENKLFPKNFDFASVPSLREEAREKLSLIKPISVGQASRISGVSPADISVLLIYLEKGRREKNA